VVTYLLTGRERTLEAAASQGRGDRGHRAAAHAQQIVLGHEDPEALGGQPASPWV
jgi:hypothetical protein